MVMLRTILTQRLQFSPLVSPAITPQSAHFNISEFSNYPGYYTPRESPMLEAQHVQSHRPHQHVSRGSIGQIAVHPIPMQVDLVMEEYQPNNPNQTTTKRSKRKSGSNKAPVRVVQQSPAMKPQRKRHTSTAITPELAATLLATRRSDVSPYISALAREPNSHSSSGMDSVSPEPLSEPLMGPPRPPRGSAPPSRSLSRHQSRADLTPDPSGKGSSVTPASLMHLPRQPNPSIENDSAQPLSRQQSAANLGLAVTVDTAPSIAPPPKPSLARLATSQPTTRLPASTSSTPSTRDGSRSKSTTIPFMHTFQTSPQILASNQKTTSGSPQIGNDRIRKRSGATTGSLQASLSAPPKIGPSIKPLLPEGARAATAASANSALLLAAKSNYQNIVEGNSLQLGLEYPEHMSQNLTNKRTSHKIAEQGRRQRINTALQEIATLLPNPTVGARSLEDVSEDPGGVSSVSPVAERVPKQHPGSMSANLAAQTTSKASTVEAAIEYIKKLQQELDETRIKLQAAEERLGGATAGRSAGGKVGAVAVAVGDEGGGSVGGEEIRVVEEG